MKKQPQKYALIGTSCVGKTTLITTLHEKLQDKINKTVIVSEAAREYFTKVKARNPFSYMHQKNIQQLALKQEKQMLKENPKIILCDRSVVDAIVYVQTMKDYTGADKLLKKMKNWFPTYTHFFLLDPKDVPYQTDNVRKEQQSLREAFHQTFLSVLSEIKAPYTLIQGTKKARITTMNNLIQNNLQ